MPIPGSFVGLTLLAFAAPAAGDEPSAKRAEELFAADNLVAWCIVPFDAKKRRPAERAAMVERLGLKKVAYDWRTEHVPTFEAEIVEYRKRGIEFFAFWSWHPAMEPLIRKHGVKPQIWRTCPSPAGESDAERAAKAAKELLPLVKKAGELGCRFGLYNHGGWGGEPQNLVAVCRVLREQHDTDHVGIVYNFHHGHGHVERFAEAFAAMEPFLLCVNLNGMADPRTVKGGRNKIVTLGEGMHERAMIDVILRSDYDGPVGILDHRSELDAEQSLRSNLDGLRRLVETR